MRSPGKGAQRRVRATLKLFFLNLTQLFNLHSSNYLHKFPYQLFQIND